MILVDANLLLYAVNEAAEEHEAARSWLDERLNGTARVGLAWPALLAFVRVAATPRLFPASSTVQEAWQRVTDWLAQPPVWIPTPTPRHAEILATLVPSAGSARLVPDAHLAALAMEHGLRLCSADGDFARFPGLAWENPLL